MFFQIFQSAVTSLRLPLGTIISENKISGDCGRRHVVDFAAFNLCTKGQATDENPAKITFDIDASRVSKKKVFFCCL